MLYAVAMLASVALVLVNVFFVAAEFAIVKIRPSRLEQLAARGQRRARDHPRARTGAHLRYLGEAVGFEHGPLHHIGRDSRCGANAAFAL